MSSYFSYLHLAIKGAKVQKNSSPMWAHVSPPYGRKVHKAGARVQKIETGVKNKYPLCPKEFLQVQHKLIQVHKNYHCKVQETRMQVFHIFRAPRFKKKWPGHARSKKYVQVQERVPRSKKHASLVRPSSGKKMKEARRMLDIGSGGEIIFVQSQVR